MPLVANPYMPGSYDEPNVQEYQDPSYSDENSAFTQATFLDYLNNNFSGNLDYERTLELLKKEHDFSALEAQKARDFSERMSNSATAR